MSPLKSWTPLGTRLWKMVLVAGSGAMLLTFLMTPRSGLCQRSGRLSSPYASPDRPPDAEYSSPYESPDRSSDLGLQDWARPSVPSKRQHPYTSSDRKDSRSMRTNQQLPSEPVPVDGGLIWLLLVGGGYGVRRLYISNDENR